jgi:hypothetical protein
VPEILRRLAAARAAVEQSHHLLLTPSPEVLDRCSDILFQAIGQLSAPPLPPKTPAHDPRVLAEARELRRQVLIAGRLLEAAASYHFGWNRVLRSMVSGYTAHGDAAPFARPGRLAVEG